MVSSTWFGVLLLLGYFLAAEALNAADAESLGLSLPMNISDPSTLLNESTQDINSTASNSLEIECNGAVYGHNPNIADCEGAWQSIVPDSEQRTFGERDTGLPDGTFTLPYIIFGGRLAKARASCRLRNDPLTLSR